LPDPRSSINRLHLLVDVVVMSLCGVLAGADGPEAIEEWAVAQEEWLRQHLELPHGIPSHDTFRRFLERVDPQAFQRCFAAWIESLSTATADGVRLLAVDGKTLRRSHDRKHRLGPLHRVLPASVEFPGRRGLVRLRAGQACRRRSARRLRDDRRG
jgi:DDE_Tnp_1-associated